MANEEVIDQYIDRNSIKSDTQFLIDELGKLKTSITTFPALELQVKNSNNITQLTAAYNGLKNEQTAIANSTQIVTERISQLNGSSAEFTKVLKLQTEATDKAASADLKSANAALARAKADEIKIRSTILQEKELERLIALEEKRNAVSAKQNVANDVAAGREKILMLRQQQEAEEKLLQAEQQRIAAEDQHLSGNYNPGGGKGNTPVNSPLNLTVDQGNIALVKSYESEIAKLTLEQKNALSAFNAGTISQNAYKTIVVQNTEKINGYRKSVSDLNKEIKLTSAVNEAERNSLQRAQALIALYTNEKKKLNLATADGVLMNNNYNKAIAASNAFILKNADAETARVKNIGNYGSALNRILGPLRTIANILPGIGLSGLFLLAFEGIKKAADYLGIFNTKLSETEKQRQLLTKIENDAIEGTAKESTNLQILKASIENVNVPMATRLQGIKNLKEEYPDLFKGLTNEQILTGKVGDAYDLAAAAILRKARANAAASEIEKLSAANTKIILDSTLKAEEVNNRIAAATADRDESGVVVNSKKDVQKILSDDFNRQKKADQDEINENNKKVNILLKIAVDGADQIIKIDKEKKEKLAKQKTEKEDPAIAAAKRLNEELIKLNNKTFLTLEEQERVHFLERIKILQKGGLDIIEAQKAAEIEQGTIRQQRIQEQAEQESNTREAQLEKDSKKLIDPVVKFEENRTGIEKEQSDKRTQIAEDEAKKKEEIIERAALEALSIEQSIGDAQFEKQKNKLQEQIDLLDEKSKREIDAVNASTRTEQDKAAAIAIINARAEAERKEFVKRQKKIDYDKAVFDKEITVVTLLGQIAIALVKGQFAAAATAGAALIKLLVTPIPKYKHGKNRNDNYEGPAIWGDGGQSEVKVSEDGSIEVSPNTPTLTNVKRNDIIIPSVEEFTAQATRRVSRNLAGVPVDQNNYGKEMTAALVSKLTSLENTIKNKKEVHNRVTQQGIAQSFKHAEWWTTYANDQTNW